MWYDRSSADDIVHRLKLVRGSFQGSPAGLCAGFLCCSSTNLLLIWEYRLPAELLAMQATRSASVCIDCTASSNLYLCVVEQFACLQSHADKLSNPAAAPLPYLCMLKAKATCRPPNSCPTPCNSLALHECTHVIALYLQCRPDSAPHPAAVPRSLPAQPRHTLPARPPRQGPNPPAVCTVPGGVPEGHTMCCAALFLES